MIRVHDVHHIRCHLKHPGILADSYTARKFVTALPKRLRKILFLSEGALGVIRRFQPRTERLLRRSFLASGGHAVRFVRVSKTSHANGFQISLRHPRSNTWVFLNEREDISIFNAPVDRRPMARRCWQLIRSRKDTLSRLDPVRLVSQTRYTQV